ncbi:MAG: phosphoribosylformylglycinamidine cyclo-ligase [Halobacteriovorax sp.]|nr:phosphoribosylformylglycinamidine cyclo-ligase [Halobacteriovorax sp.]|tara:strand:- start:43 stop:1023 length:981 start_codon:yes stop_codon:yes gene_type:complete
MDYKEAGVDIEKGDAFVEKIKSKVTRTYGERVLEGVGGFACLYKIDDERILAAGTDGVGTKLMLAKQLDIHNTVGIDLVAMCTNDVLCTGAKPLFFMDYLATGKLEVDTAASVLDGIIEGCMQSKAALIGGETAEMPGMYEDGEYDLAGFCVGEINKEDLLGGDKIKPGQTIIGLASSGPHSNGFSLIRKLLKEDETDLLKLALTPTKIYEDTLRPLINNKLITSAAHITGGGLTNIARNNKNLDYVLDFLPSLDEVSPIFSVLAKRSGLENPELYRTFNMGLGLVFTTDQPEKVLNLLGEEKAWRLGTVEPGNGKVNVKALGFSY